MPLLNELMQIEHVVQRFVGVHPPAQPLYAMLLLELIEGLVRENGSIQDLLLDLFPEMVGEVSVKGLVETYTCIDQIRDAAFNKFGAINLKFRCKFKDQ